MAAPDKIVLVDGSNLVYRAYYAIPSRFQTAGGLHTNAIYGFATMFRKLLSGRKPAYGAVVFDAPGPTFRDEKYAEYKATRDPMPDELREQLPWIDRLVAAHHFPLLRVPGYEADDVIGTLTRRAAEKGMEVVIVSADKDFAQLIDGGVRMQDTLRDVIYDPDLVKKKWGVPPSQIVDLLALMGDKIDNIPGVPGIGQKGAAQLLERYANLDGIYAHIDELKGKQKQSLLDHKDDAYLSQELATIDQHVPLDVGFDDLAIVPPENGALNELYKELEFYSLLTEEQLKHEGEGEGAEVANFQSADEVKAFLDAIPQGQPLALWPIYDLPAVVTGAFVGLGLAWEEGRSGFLALEGPSSPLGDVGLEAARAFLEDPSRPKVAHNAKQLWMLLKRKGIALEGVAGDTMLASFLIEPTKLIPHELAQLTREYLQRTPRPLKGLIGSGQSQKRFSECDPSELSAYACHLADLVRALWPILEKRCAEEGQTRYLREIDLPLSWVLGQMELDGIAVDPDDLKRIGDELQRRLDEEEARVHTLAGQKFNIASTKQLSKVLFEDLSLPVIKRTKSGYSTDSEVLERLAPKHEIARAILEHRKLAKLINTYTEVLQKAVSPETGRIHASFQQTVGATGRLITTDPDLQRTPVKTPEGKRIRQAFVADPGMKIISADWSQIELRILAHASSDPLLLESFEKGADVHRRTASELFSVPPEQVTPEQRGIGKTVNFATIYGQGATALGQILSVPRKEAQGYIEGYFRAYAGVRSWLDRTIEEAHERGYVTTLLGRRRYIPELTSNNQSDRAMGERIAANTPIQGSAADICKLAMLRIADELRSDGFHTKMLLQVHDELVFEAPEGEVERAAALVRGHMERAFDLRVPLVVDVGIGASWGDAKG